MRSQQTFLFFVFIVLSVSCTDSFVYANQFEKYSGFSSEVSLERAKRSHQTPEYGSFPFFFANPELDVFQADSKFRYTWLDFQINSTFEEKRTNARYEIFNRKWLFFTEYYIEDGSETSGFLEKFDLSDDDLDSELIEIDYFESSGPEESVKDSLGELATDSAVESVVEHHRAFPQETIVFDTDSATIDFRWLISRQSGFCHAPYLNETFVDAVALAKETALTLDIPIQTNKKVEAFIRLYTKRKRSILVKAIERMPLYQEMISRILKENDLPQNLIYLAIVESNLMPNARSHANAVGLWQFMSYTGKYYGLTRSWWHDDRFDPERSTVAAAKYLKELNKLFKGDWELTLAAYNSGAARVRRAIRYAERKGKPTDYWSLKLPRETRGYVPAFYAVATIFSDLEKYNFQPIKNTQKTVQKSTINVGGGISLKQLSQILELKHDELMEMNPRLRLKGLTPPTLQHFEIAVPAHIELTQAQQSELGDLTKNRYKQWKLHRVKSGDTLWSISRYYKIPMSQILANNRLRKRNLLRIGQKLMLPIPSDWVPPKTPSKTEQAKSDLKKLPGTTLVHVVQKGETLWKISQKYDVSIEKIKYWNRRVLRRKYLKIGTEIVLKLPTADAGKPM